ncbi:peptide ligase PGM1-related protein [Lyngbya confervoides]|uniref:Peptide ligase PGM1-related protein n=1 Tax=Lyngbya confervoides BDU141951 TaxID=1574623 RepID=A0ABD4T0W6_9CYAN|nr:peptide ligase PGM1-related protein [Lyngbya confervoides]MCM1982250.1 peptide ligase PGM1-related protein [Lyngbya confervoides BDU141951]
MSPELSPDLAHNFRRLQAQLRDRWATIRDARYGNTDILVVPSFSLDQQELQKIEGFLHYEERMLFSLIRLRNPRARLIFVTSQPLPSIVIDYYLQLLPGIPFSHARDRLLLLPIYDLSLKPLSQKILERPRLIERIKTALRPDCAYMVCFNSTALEQELSVRLNIPLFAADPTLLQWGTKSGSRQVFRDCAIPHPDGSLLLANQEDLVLEAARLWHRNPDLKRLVVKLNEGFSGEGNAILSLLPLDQSRQWALDQRQGYIRDRLPHMAFESPTETWESFQAQIQELGVIVEAFIEGETKRSPSVQGQINPDGSVEILSTHDQILGGPSGQIYLGCHFPADVAYRLMLHDYGQRIGEYLGKLGVLERYGVDFVAVAHPLPSGEVHWTLDAIEINLRKGGTTHPFMTLKLLTNGDYIAESGLFLGKQGAAKYYLATDNLQRDSYRGLMPTDLMDIIAHHGLHFDTGSETGTVFHLMGCLSEFGKLGMTSIGNSPEEAQRVHQRVIQVLDAETTGPYSDGSFHTHPIAPIVWHHSGD